MHTPLQIQEDRFDEVSLGFQMSIVHQNVWVPNSSAEEGGLQAPSLRLLCQDRWRQLLVIPDQDQVAATAAQGDQSGGFHRLGTLVNDDVLELHALQKIIARAAASGDNHLRLLQHPLHLLATLAQGSGIKSPSETASHSGFWLLLLLFVPTIAGGGLLEGKAAGLDTPLLQIIVQVVSCHIRVCNTQDPLPQRLPSQYHACRSGRLARSWRSVDQGEASLQGGSHGQRLCWCKRGTSLEGSVSRQGHSLLDGRRIDGLVGFLGQGRGALRVVAVKALRQYGSKDWREVRWNLPNLQFLHLVCLREFVQSLQ
mmetsp:Transcript_52159/g.111023  ORF Transcript_52159/g.111023 Transcript_52159/m.111023 type:complete len:312 (-) Transcript_52159:2013-2948(-)